MVVRRGLRARARGVAGITGQDGVGGRGTGAAPRGVAIVGATGSIGRSALDVIRRHPDRLRAVALAAHHQWEQVCTAAVAGGAEAVALADPHAADQARARLVGTSIRVLDGDAGVAEVAGWPSAAVTLAAAAGVAGLPPVVSALESGRDVALANKESLVAAGRLVTALATAHGVRLLPVDSEHSAIFQCLHGRNPAGVARLWLTASGGPFRNWPAARIDAATPAEALRHPTWNMGRRVTVDSATLLNKGLEIIEAAWLFGVATDAISVAVHPQSVVHSLVQFVDGTWLAQCAETDMRLPIAHALSYPERWAWTDGAGIDLFALGHLDFEAPDTLRFPCLALAYEAARRGRLAPAALNAADEVAVARFLAGEIRFGDIPRVIEHALGQHTPGDDGDLRSVLSADSAARRHAGEWSPSRTFPASAQGTGATLPGRRRKEATS